MSIEMVSAQVQTLRAEMRADFNKVFDKIGTMEKRACPCPKVIGMEKDLAAVAGQVTEQKKTAADMLTRVLDVVFRYGPLALAAFWNRIF